MKSFLGVLRGCGKKSDIFPERFSHLKRNQPRADELVMLLSAHLRHAVERSDFRHSRRRIQGDLGYIDYV